MDTYCFVRDERIPTPEPRFEGVDVTECLVSGLDKLWVLGIHGVHYQGSGIDVDVYHDANPTLRSRLCSFFKKFGYVSEEYLLARSETTV